MSNYKVEIKVKNGRLSRMMEDRGVANAAELARLVGSNPSSMGDVLNLAITAYTNNGKLRAPYALICDYFMCEIESVCPEDHYYIELTENSRHIYVNKDQLLSIENRSTDPMLLASMNDYTVADMVASLPDRSAKMMIMRLSDGMTWEAIGKKFDLSTARCIQIYKKSLRQLHHPSLKLKDKFNEMVEH